MNKNSALRGNQSGTHDPKQSENSARMKGKATNTSGMSSPAAGRGDERRSGYGTSNANMHTHAGNTGFSSGQISPQTQDKANERMGAKGRESGSTGAVGRAYRVNEEGP